MSNDAKKSTPDDVARPPEVGMYEVIAEEGATHNGTEYKKGAVVEIRKALAARFPKVYKPKA